MKNQTPGERVQLLRKEAGLSRDEFADKIKIARSTVQLLENKPNYKMNIFQIEAICEFFDTHPLYILRGYPPVHGEFIGIDKELNVLMAEYNLTSDDLKKIITLFKEMTELGQKFIDKDKK
jgi:transcriptional regulator with XRE-family HTH domain